MTEALRRNGFSTIQSDAVEYVDSLSSPPLEYNVTRIPKHPAVGTEVFRGRGLGPDFLACELPPVKGVVPECL